jgi:hypothetical protein
VDQSVDVRLTVTEISSLNEVLELPGTEATGRVGELEGPQEVGGLLEVGADSVDLVDEVLNADDAVCAEVLLNDGVVGERDALLVDLSVTALVDELTDGLQVGVSVSDEGLDDLEHLSSGLGETDEDTVVDLEKTEQLEGLALLGVDLVDTAGGSVDWVSTMLVCGYAPLDADGEDELGLGGHEERVVLAGSTLGLNDVALSFGVLGSVLLRTLEDNGALLLVGLRES